MSEFKKRPLEFYGKPVTAFTQGRFKHILQPQECPFVGKRCIRQRKSDPGQTIGACTVGYQGFPLIICPQQFMERDQIFLDSIKLLKPGLQYFIVPELSMPGGHIDFFLVGMEGNEIADYVGIEIQGLDTTGSGGIWEARQDLLGGQLMENYRYGINWKMSAKTILVQMHHKAASFESLGKKLVLAIQKRFFEYIAAEFQTEQLRSANDKDSIHLHLYDCVLFGSEMRIVLNERKSTDVRGIERMLNLGRTSDVLEQEVLKRIKAKMSDARFIEIPVD